MISEKEEAFVREKVIPLFIGWTISNATLALRYAEEYLLDAMPVTKIPGKSVQEETGK